MAESPRERWAEIERLLDQALELLPVDRAAFLERVCAGDLALRAEVERLLRAAEAADKFLEEPAPTYAAPLLARLAEGSAPAPGARLGNYEILRELGRGGMATVYLARDLKLDREVALKVLRPELAAVLGAERFLQEIRISAKLDHPHILTLIDSGEGDGFVWYVLPYVRGESLRDKLTREKQLSLDETVRIATQVASALDYAHRHGVIHRDIKPENILLHEGEAVVADFGIALAVREAGGQRLTETGLSLGTPQYMSPEQATGGRELDARSDVYSLAAVVYEMLAGEPPHTGATAQAVIAKLLTERPTRIRTVRDTVPEGIDSAVARALAKVPADRFGGMAEFAAALVAPRPVSIAGWRRRRLTVAAGIVGGLVLAVALWLAVRATAGPRGTTFAVRDRSQLTFTGNATAPAISADGKQLAYVVKHCAGTPCVYGIEVQDVSGGATRRVVDGASALYVIGWSPDRRFLIFTGTIAARYGTYIVSPLGGAARFLGIPRLEDFPGAFFAGGDSLLLTPPLSRGGVAWVWVTNLDGDHRDSFRIERPGDFLSGAWPLTGGRWVLVRVSTRGRPEWRIVDRQGHQQDVFRPSSEATEAFARVTADALWLQQFSVGSSQGALVHLPINARDGKFLEPADTVPLMLRQSFDIAADAGTVVYGEGTDQYEIWALELADALRGRFSPERLLLSYTSLALVGGVSPDGGRVLINHRAAGLGGERGVIDILPFEGGGPVTHTPSGVLIGSIGSRWMPDGEAFCYAERADRGVRFVTVDPRTGVRLGTFAIGDSAVVDFEPLADGGWVWIPPSQGGLRFQRPGDQQPRDVPRRDVGGRVFSVTAVPEGPRIVTIEWKATEDSMRVHVISLLDGRATHWATFFGERATKAAVLPDGSIIVPIWETQETVTLFRLRGPGRIERVGTIPRPVDMIRVSSDGRRVVVSTRESRGDIWLARIGRVGH